MCSRVGTNRLLYILQTSCRDLTHYWLQLDLFLHVESTKFKLLNFPVKLIKVRLILKSFGLATNEIRWRL